MRFDPAYASRKYHWEASRAGDHKSWRDAKGRCVIVIGCVRAGVIGRFSLQDVEGLYEKVRVDCPLKGGRDYIRVMGGTLGWYVEVYNPLDVGAGEGGEGGLLTVAG